MLLQRTLVTLVILPVGLAAIYLGGIPYFIVVNIFLLLAAYEYGQLFRAGGIKPAGFLLVAGSFLLGLSRMLNGFNDLSGQGLIKTLLSAPFLVSLLILASITYHLVDYERGRDQAGIDFSATLSGIFYVGWIGAYFFSIRFLPHGLWWSLLVLASTWITDAGAYLIGKNFGRHVLSQRLSPKKTWEGYWGGVASGALGGAAIVAAGRLITGPGWAIAPVQGALVGLGLGLVTILGDLGESMIKRTFGVKDSGNLLPGHGGFFDRIDSWLWAGVIGYYLVVLFFSN